MNLRRGRLTNGLKFILQSLDVTLHQLFFLFVITYF